MNAEARKENIVALESLLGLSTHNSKKIVGSSILITGGKFYPALNEFLKDILLRTFEFVDTEYSIEKSFTCEVILGNTSPLTSGPFVFLGQTTDNKLVASFSKSPEKLRADYPRFLYLILSCYAAAVVLKRIIGDNLTVLSDDEIVIDCKLLIPDPTIFDLKIDIGDCYLAGAGAIGNAFLYALRTFSVQGIIHVADPDKIDGRNLNRCLFFQNEDINKNKAQVLVNYAQPFFKGVALDAIPDVLQNANPNEGNWLKKLIVGVDSRRARRGLQDEEIPGEVFDASTTGIEEIVLHYHKQPLKGLACLCCIYSKEEQEQAREKHIAEALGVALEQVTQLRIDEAAAETICKKYMQLQPQDLIGIPYDTLFKELCGEGKLKNAEDKQVLAPLSFVSALAGAMLALLFIQRHVEKSLSYNYWRMSPWKKPNFRLQQIQHTNPECEFCSNDLKPIVAEKIWSIH
ncbi:MAG: ThiF family adenylyltransferase [Flavisolibacter sp.]